LGALFSHCVAAKLKRTTSSPVVVLMSWCKLIGLTPVTSSTIASMSGRAVSIRCVRTLFQEVSALFGRQLLDQLLFGCGQHAVEADHEKVTDQVGVNVLGSPAHLILFKTADSVADGGFDFSLALHGDLERGPIPLGIRGAQPT
jgi:hypothetical protein